MFAFLGRFVYRHRRLVVGVMTLMLLIGGVFGLGLPAQLSQSGYDDPGSESTQAAKIADQAFGRDHASDIILVYTAPEGQTVDDPDFVAKVTANLERAQAEHPDTIGRINSYWSLKSPLLADPSKQHAFASVELTADTDTASLEQFKSLEGVFDIPGVTVEISGLQAIGDALGTGMANDTLRAELIALPLVAILLFFVFGGVVAALLPVLIGVLTIAGATGLMWVLTHFMDVNTFAQPVVTLIGLGMAIDYGLFMVSRFREELAEGYDTEAAIRRTVITAGRTVIFSATMLVVAFTGLLMFPQGFLKSVALGGLAAIGLAAICSVTVLPAILGMLGKRVDAWGLPFLRKTKTKQEIENGFWGKLTDWVMKHPVWVATPIIVVLLLLIVPFKNIAFGGITEKYLPPANETRIAQEHFDELFPSFRTNPVNVVVTGATPQQIFDIALEANKVPGFTGPFMPKAPVDGVNMLTSGLIDPDRPGDSINELRSIPAPEGVEILVGGVPAMTQDTVTALQDRLPMMLIFIVLVTTLLMFLAFGSLVLPIKAVLMSALGLGATLGVLTWIFLDGHGSSILDFTPGPLMPAVLVLLLAVIFGLSTDYEVFLLSRMVEARERGATTREAIRVGTAHTGRIITAAALILIVVTGAFGFSEIVMMKYIAYGMIAALILDATVIRMLLVPAIMTLLGDDCWWAPKWMKRVQNKIGLGEVHLPDELPAHRTAAANQVTTVIPRITTDLTPAFAAERPAPAPIAPAPTSATQGAAGTPATEPPTVAVRRPTILPPQNSSAGEAAERGPAERGPADRGPADRAPSAAGPSGPGSPSDPGSPSAARFPLPPVTPAGPVTPRLEPLAPRERPQPATPPVQPEPSPRRRPRTPDPRIAERLAAERLAAERRANEPPAKEQRAAEPRSAEPLSAEPRSAEPRSAEPLSAEPRHPAPGTARSAPNHVPSSQVPPAKEEPPRRRRANPGNLPSDSAARQFSGKSSWTDRPQPLYPWEDRPSAPARPSLPESGEPPAPRTTPPAGTPPAGTPAPTSPPAGGRRRAPEPPAVQPPAPAEDTDAEDNRRHRDTDNTEQVTVEDLLRRSREDRGQ